MSGKPRLGVGLIGTGFMGKTHGLAFNLAARAFDLPMRVELAALADIRLDAARAAADRLGFSRATDDWRDLLTDPSVQVIAITTPNALHKEMALAAIAAGRHVYCEKPLAPTLADCREMTDAAERAGLVTQVGFNYLRNPLIALAKDIIDSGEIGEIRSVRAIHAEDFMADATIPWSWRLDPAGGGGAIADIGSHIVAALRHLVGPVRRVLGQLSTHVAQRPVARGSAETRAVEVDDVARALLDFESGASGSFEANWIATGRHMQHDFEIYGSKGSLAFTQERMNEIRLFKVGEPDVTRGFKTIWSGPAHEPYGAFCVAPGHHIGFNELKAIEVKELVEAIAGGAKPATDFREASEVERVMAAVQRSAAESRWVELD
ncbi:Gfo/Idh/MocA family protein [Antarcticirhabdus aurantiaca]|uniref:Gfo/Idh/MocA family oxidoreductase n=1 Tax=Antarcticirhabdus aurantiaca TaxID=2606717 RepID=A0ACD4NQQ6_9HYPH|nr:Gfo/Idh/MocA family oxidoreductase [Antarcticirhabdus aurantiaca]WAJ29152.1 Gfo/Idh/MocA family oxidoreductase [Jeongeuplla avenae]